jgi:LmbE family N-acetylglucosaminyl deacetylase
VLIRDIARVLVIFAHPDDAEWMFGGTIARLVAGGARVDYVCCTDGSNGGVDVSVSAAELAATRAAELRAAADVLGVGEIVMLDYPNDQLTPSVDLRRDLVRQIRRLRPQLVLAMAPQRLLDAPIDLLHADHLASAEAALIAAYPEALMPRIYPELADEGLSAHAVTEVWTSAYADADQYVDVSDFADQKMTAIWCHTSQNGLAKGDRNGLFRNQVAPPMVEAGRRIGCQYAERFKRTEIAS